MPISNRRRLLEITAVLLTAAGKFVFMDLVDWRLPYILAVIFGWGSYLVYRKKKDRQYWGFRTDNFRLVAKRILPFGLACIVTFTAIGIYQDSIHISWTIIPVLILYPLWGMMQQYLLIALTTGNLQDMNGLKLQKSIILFTTALLFGLIHYPHWWLIAGSFVLALFYGFVYWRERNIYALGLFHGWLGGLFYYTVVDRDPLLELFEKL